MTKIGQRSLNPPIAPIPVFRRHPHHEILNLSPRAGSSRTAMITAVGFPGDQSAVPGQKRFRCDDGRHLPQNASGQPLGFGRQTPTLIVAEAKPFASQLLPQDPVLLS